MDGDRPVDAVAAEAMHAALCLRDEEANAQGGYVSAIRCRIMPY